MPKVYDWIVESYDKTADKVEALEKEIIKIEQEHQDYCYRRFVGETGVSIGALVSGTAFGEEKQRYKVVRIEFGRLPRIFVRRLRVDGTEVGSQYQLTSDPKLIE